jgi:hypothetical protein
MKLEIEKFYALDFESSEIYKLMKDEYNIKVKWYWINNLRIYKR